MTDKQRHILVATGLLSPFAMALLALLPPTAHLFRLIGSIKNVEIAMLAKAVWLCGLGTISIFFVKRIKEAKALAALFYFALMLPLSLSYDHRVIDGAQGARFITFLSAVLGDIRRLVL